MRSDITAEAIYQKMGFAVRSFNTRNKFNKLKLFLNEVAANNRRQQELQSKFMKIRINNQLEKVDSQIVSIVLNR